MGVMSSRMAARAGIEPTYSVPKAEVLTFGRPSSNMNGFKTWRSIDMVPEAGVEPACLSATGFESVAPLGHVVITASIAIYQLYMLFESLAIDKFSIRAN